MFLHKTSGSEWVKNATSLLLIIILVPVFFFLNSKIKIWKSRLLPLFISYRSSGEKLRKYQANSSCVIMSVILMTTLFYKTLILLGEI